MNNSVILQGKDENEMHLLRHSFTREAKKKTHKTNKNEKTKERKKKKLQKTQKTKTHIFKNEDAYFQEQRRIFSRTKTHIFKKEDAKKKTKRKTQILEERCKLSSDEYCSGTCAHIMCQKLKPNIQHSSTSL